MTQNYLKQKINTRNRNMLAARMRQDPAPLPVSHQKRVETFHEKANETAGQEVQPISMDLSNGGLEKANAIAFRQMLIDEEFQEARVALGKLAEAVYQKRLDLSSLKEDVLKEFADLLYVVYGSAVALGMNLDEAFERVHESNMSKLPEPGTKPLLDENGKVLKPATYQKPHLEDLV